MARRRTTFESKQTVSTNPSSWWEDRWRIEKPRPEDQEPRYREEQERYEQERKRAAYYRPIEEIERPRSEDQEPRYREEQERYESGRPREYYRTVRETERPVSEEEEQGRYYREEQEGYEQGRQGVEGEERKDIFRIWADSSNVVSKMLEDTYVNLYKPWIESTGEMYNKAAELARNATPESYRAFYEEWVKTYQNSIGRFYPISTQKFDKQTLEKLLSSAEDSKQLIQSWINLLDDASNKTRELLQGTPDPEKYRQSSQIWMRTYGKIFEGLLTLPTMERTRGVFESYTGIPGIYLRSFAQMSKIWRNAFTAMYWPWTDSMMRLHGKMAEISRGGARSEAYKEFYNLWMDAYKQTYSRLFDIRSARSASKEMADSFMRNMNVYLNMYTSWMDILENISQRTTDISKRTTEPETYKDFYNNWARMYERTFDDFSKYVPAIGPMRYMMEPVKNAAKIYTDMFTNISSMWMRPVLGSTSRD